MKFIKSSLIALLMLAGVSTALPLVVSNTASADAKSEILDGAGTADSGGGVTVEGAVQDVVNILLFVIGIVAVVIIIIGGIMYATSAGDPSKAKKAKDTILYAVIGLVVAILAYAIVDFVVGAL